MSYWNSKIGIDVLIQERVSLIGPENEFDFPNIDIHGIDEDTIKWAPTFPDAIEAVKKFIDGEICVCHTQFDRVSINRALQKFEIESTTSKYLRSTEIARRT